MFATEARVNAHHALNPELDGLPTPVCYTGRTEDMGSPHAANKLYNSRADRNTR